MIVGVSPSNQDGKGGLILIGLGPQDHEYLKEEGFSSRDFKLPATSIIQRPYPETWDVLVIEVKEGDDFGELVKDILSEHGLDRDKIDTLELQEGQEPPEV